MTMQNLKIDPEKNTEGNHVVFGSSGFLFALFSNPQAADIAYGNLLKKGYRREDITLAMSDKTRSAYFSEAKENFLASDLGNNSLEGLGVGAAVGGTLGAIAAGIAAMGTTLSIPGLGLLLSGALAASIAGAGAGSAVGGLVGSLVGLGIPDEEVQILQEGLIKEGVLLGLKPKTEEEKLQIRQEWIDLQNHNFTPANAVSF